MSEFTAFIQVFIASFFFFSWVSFKLNEDNSKLTKLLSLIFFILAMLTVLGTMISARLLAINEGMTYLITVAEPFIVTMIIVIGLVILIMILRLLFLMKDIVQDFLPKLFDFRGVDRAKNRRS